MNKHYIDASTLLKDAVSLAIRTMESGFLPDLIIGIWRGGAPIAVTMHEVFAYTGLQCQHLPLVANSYQGMQQQSQVSIEGLELLKQKITPDSKILLVDDVWDTGKTIDCLLEKLTGLYSGFSPEIRVAVPYYKPGKNLSSHVPDFYLHENNAWLVFPHELTGLDDDELISAKTDFLEHSAALLKLKNMNRGADN